MYEEFIIMYIGLGVIFAINIVTLVMVCVLMSRNRGKGTNIKSYQPGFSAPFGNVVYCKSCGTQFYSSAGICPKCGKAR